MKGLVGYLGRSSVDLEIEGATLQVRIEPLSSPRRARTHEGLSQELTATKTTYTDPGIDLTFASR